jgi:hypothetical protein
VSKFDRELGEPNLERLASDEVTSALDAFDKSDWTTSDFRHQFPEDESSLFRILVDATLSHKFRSVLQ